MAKSTSSKKNTKRVVRSAPTLKVTTVRRLRRLGYSIGDIAAAYKTTRMTIYRRFGKAALAI